MGLKSIKNDDIDKLKVIILILLNFEPNIWFKVAYVLACILLVLLCIEVILVCVLMKKYGYEKSSGDLFDWFCEIFDFIPIVMIIHISSDFLNTVDVAEIVSDGLDEVNWVFV